MRSAFTIVQHRKESARDDFPLHGAAAILIALAALAACNRDAPGKGGGARTASASVVENSNAPAAEERGTGIEACTLLDRGDVSRIFGPLRDEPKPDRGLRGENDCRWHNEEGQWLKASLYSASRWQLEKAIVSEMYPRPVAGAGDEAFSVRQGTDNVVHVRKGEAVIEVSCSCGIEKTESLARMAAARL